jgi:hypothetical protein
MKLPEFLMPVVSFVRHHRVVTLVVVLIVAGTIFALVILPSPAVEPTFGDTPRPVQRIPKPKEYPPKTLRTWGVDPFRDVLRDREEERRKREEEEAKRAEEEARRLAREATARRLKEEAERKAREEAEKKATEERERRERERQEVERRKKIILSITVDGIIFDPKGASRAIIEKEPYGIGQTVIKQGVEVIIEAVEKNAVVFKDAKSGKTYRVPLSR